MQREIAIVFSAIVGMVLLFLWVRYIACRIISAKAKNKPNFVYYSTLGYLLGGTFFLFFMCTHMFTVDFSSLTTLRIDGEINRDLWIFIFAFFGVSLIVHPLRFKVALQNGNITYRTFRETKTFQLSDITEVKGYVGWSTFGGSGARRVEIPMQTNYFYSGEEELMRLGGNSSAYSRLEDILKEECSVYFTGEEAPYAVTFPHSNSDPVRYYIMDFKDESKVLEIFEQCKSGKGYISEDSWQMLHLAYKHKQLYELNERVGWLKAATLDEYKVRLEKYRKANAGRFCFDNLRRL